MLWLRWLGPNSPRTAVQGRSSAGALKLALRGDAARTAPKLTDRMTTELPPKMPAMNLARYMTHIFSAKPKMLLAKKAPNKDRSRMGLRP
jgi:hypothetical protein